MRTRYVALLSPIYIIPDLFILARVPTHVLPINNPVIMQNQMHPNTHREFSAVETLEVIKRGLSQVERRIQR